MCSLLMGALTFWGLFSDNTNNEITNALGIEHSNSFNSFYIFLVDIVDMYTVVYT